MIKPKFSGGILRYDIENELEVFAYDQDEQDYDTSILGISFTWACLFTDGTGCTLSDTSPLDLTSVISKLAIPTSLASKNKDYIFTVSAIKAGSNTKTISFTVKFAEIGIEILPQKLTIEGRNFYHYKQGDKVVLRSKIFSQDLNGLDVEWTSPNYGIQPQKTDTFIWDSSFEALEGISPVIEARVFDSLHTAKTDFTLKFDDQVSILLEKDREFVNFLDEITLSASKTYVQAIGVGTTSIENNTPPPDTSTPKNLQFSFGVCFGGLISGSSELSNQKACQSTIFYTGFSWKSYVKFRISQIRSGLEPHIVVRVRTQNQKLDEFSLQEFPITLLDSVFEDSKDDLKTVLFLSESSPSEHSFNSLMYAHRVVSDLDGTNIDYFLSYFMDNYAQFRGYDDFLNLVEAILISVINIYEKNGSSLSEYTSKFDNLANNFFLHAGSSAERVSFQRIIKQRHFDLFTVRDFTGPWILRKKLCIKFFHLSLFFYPELQPTDQKGKILRKEILSHMKFHLKYQPQLESKQLSSSLLIRGFSSQSQKNVQVLSNQDGLEIGAILLDGFLVDENTGSLTSSSRSSLDYENLNLVYYILPQQLGIASGSSETQAAETTVASSTSTTSQIPSNSTHP